MDKKAQSGIGTLIIFIAMVLVAAIAAGVLIQTSSSLQNKALVTGEQSKGQISTHLEVISLSGSDGSNHYLNNFTQVVKLSPGSESIKLDELVLTFDTATITANLRYGGNVTELNNGTNGGYFTNKTMGEGNFTIRYLQEGPEFVEGYIQRGDVLQFFFESPEDIREDKHVRLNLIPKVGIPTPIDVITPNVMVQKYVYLYP
jgi:archaeal flagellin FlaB